MKKTLSLIAVVALFFASCGTATEKEAEVKDTTAKVEVAAPVVADTTKVVVVPEVVAAGVTGTTGEVK